jgi:3-oxoadipate enol-lactonase
VLTWDYRGLYGSRAASAPIRVDVPAHADDLADLLSAFGGERVSIVGWSMGVQVALELAQRAPERVSELVLINGAGGRPMANLRVPLAERWLPDLIERLRPHQALGSRLFARMVRSRGAAELVRLLHVVNPRLEADEILELARQFTELDFDVYLRTLAALQDHDATGTLSQVTARTLVIAGGHDPLFSPRVARELTRKLKHGELYVVPKATHYAPLEFPELVNARIERFLAEAASPRATARDGLRPQDRLTDAQAGATLEP